MFNVLNGEDEILCIDIENDFGFFVVAVLYSYENFASKKFLAFNVLFSLSDLCEGLTQAIGKTVKYVQIPNEQFKSYFTLFMADETFG